MSEGKIRTEAHDRIFKIIIDNPAKKNSFTPAMMEQLSDALTELHSNETYWVGVICAEGKDFTDTGVALLPRLFFDYGAFSLRAPRNVGVEGLCAAAGKLLAANELVFELRGHRVAPMMLFDLNGGGPPKHFELTLTSKTGKIAGLCCRSAGEALEVLAIERHFGVSSIIHFSGSVAPFGQTLPLISAPPFAVGFTLSFRWYQASASQVYGIDLYSAEQA